VRADPARALERLLELRLIERTVPVTEDPARTRRRLYRVADNFLAFWLGSVEPYRAEIERGLGRSIAGVLEKGLDDHLGRPWEAAFRDHLRRLADAGELGDGVVAIGPFWRDQPPVEIDAVVLAGRAKRAIAVGEAKWARTIRGDRIRRALEAKAQAVPKIVDDPRFVLCARETITEPGDALAVTAADVFP